MVENKTYTRREKRWVERRGGRAERGEVQRGRKSGEGGREERGKRAKIEMSRYCVDSVCGVGQKSRR